MLMQNFEVTNKEHYGMLWLFCSGQFFSLPLIRYIVNEGLAKIATEQFTNNDFITAIAIN